MSRLNSIMYTVGADEVKAEDKPAVNETNGNNLPAVPFLSQRLISGIENKWLIIAAAGLLVLSKMKR